MKNKALTRTFVPFYLKPIEYTGFARPALNGDWLRDDASPKNHQNSEAGRLINYSGGVAMLGRTRGVRAAVNSECGQEGRPTWKR